MFGYLFRKLEPLIDAAITKRIIMFHDALVGRGQIKPISIERYSGADCSESGHTLLQSSPTRQNC